MVNRRGVHRRLLGLAAGALASTAGAPVRALMAGDPPDSPTRRLDPNVASSPWTGVGSVQSNGGVYSGVLVTPRFALTALHVVPAEPHAIRFQLNVDRDISHRLDVARIHRHPEFKAMTVDYGAYDLCLLELADPAPPEARVHPIKLSGLAPGDRITIVGYGASGFGSSGVSVPAVAALKRTGENVIDAVIRIAALPAPAIYLFAFDPPDGTPQRNRHRSLGNRVETGLASGDSGSPVFTSTRDGWVLAGMNTFVRDPPTAGAKRFSFGTQGGGQILAPHVPWMRTVIGPVLDPQLPPTR